MPYNLKGLIWCVDKPACLQFRVRWRCRQAIEGHQGKGDQWIDGLISWLIQLINGSLIYDQWFNLTDHIVLIKFFNEKIRGTIKWIDSVDQQLIDHSFDLIHNAIARSIDIDWLIIQCAMNGFNWSKDGLFKDQWINSINMYSSLICW